MGLYLTDGMMTKMAIEFTSNSETLVVPDTIGKRTLFVERFEGDNLLFTIQDTDTGDIRGQIQLSESEVSALSVLVQYLEDAGL